MGGAASSVKQLNPDDVPARIAPDDARKLLPDVYSDDLFRSIVFNEGVISKEDFLGAIEKEQKKIDDITAAEAEAALPSAKQDKTSNATWGLLGRLEEIGGSKYALKKEAHQIDTSKLSVNVQGPDGKAIPYVKVFVSGKRCAATDDKGMCVISAPAGTNEDGSPAVVTVSAQKLGWSTATTISHAPHTSCISITMIRVGSTRRVDMVKGGTVKDEASGTFIVIPANSLIYANGKAFAGIAQIMFTVIDSSKPAQLASMPGDLCVTDEKGEKSAITSFGAVWIDAADEKDVPLVYNPKGDGIQLELMSAVAIDAQKLQQPPSLWQWSDKEGEWKQEAVPLNTAGKSIAFSEESKEKAVAPPAKKKATKGGKKKKGGGGEEENPYWTLENFAQVFAEEPIAAYQGTLKALGWWNCDAPYHAVMLQGQLNLGSHPIAGRVVAQSIGVSYNGRATVAADENGKFSVMAQIGSQVKLEIRFGIQTGEGFGNEATVQKFVSFGPFNTADKPGTIMNLDKLEIPTD
jgi:hypothetical protein